MIRPMFLCKSETNDLRYCRSGRGPNTVKVSPSVPLHLDEQRGGLDLPDLVANSINYLILRRPVAATILADFDAGPHELLPVTLINAKGRVHSTDYVILNPLGKIDCLDVARSDMDDDEDDPAVALFGEFHLRAEAIPADRDIFRVKGIVVGYVFSERLVAFIRQRGYSNFVFEEIPP
ncbi:double-CXXCG motif protein [Nannocystaceae bacterium ST9]